MGSVSEEIKGTVEESTKEVEVGKEKEVDQLKIVTAESIARKNEIAQLKAKLDAIDAENAKKEEEKLKKSGEYETLITTKDSQIAELDKKAKAYDEYFNAVVEDVKTKLGEDWDDSYASLPLNSIQKLVKVVIKPTVEKIDVDNPNHGKKIELQSVTLTKSEEALAIERYPNFDKEKAFELFKGNKLKRLEREKLKGN